MTSSTMSFTASGISSGSPRDAIERIRPDDVPGASRIQTVRVANARNSPRSGTAQPAA